MADYESGSITFSGLGSGTDFNAIVDQLKNVESINLRRLKNWKSDWNERYLAFGDIISSVRDAKSKLSDLNSPAKFLRKLAASTNENVLSIKADANAVDGSHTVNVKQLASNAIWASTATYTSKQATLNTSTGQQDFTYTYKGVTRTLSIAPGTTLEAFANIVNQDRSNPGVKVNVIQVSGGYTFQLQGKESGAAADLSIQPSQLVGMGGGATTWISNNPIADPAAAFSTGGSLSVEHSYELTMADGTTQTLTMQGNQTQQELADAINAKVGADIATFANGKLQLSGVEKVAVTPTGGQTTTTAGKMSVDATFTGAMTDVLGTEGVPYAFDMTLTDGTTKTITIDGGKTRQDLVNKLKAEGHTVSVTGDDITGHTMNISGVSAVSGNGFTAGAGTWTWSQKTTPESSIQAGVIPKNLTYTFTDATGQNFDISLTSDQNINDLVAALNTRTPGSAALVDRDGQQYLQLNNIFGATGQGVAGQVESSGDWAIRRATDALFTVDNWPQEMSSSSNNVTDVLEGIELTLHDVGTAQISVAADLDSVRDNIQIFLDTINGVIKKVQDLSKIDSEKEVASSDPESSNYSSSQWDQQKGSVLTGNYGVQLFNTRVKSIMSSSAVGFTKITGNDFMSGDFVTALSQMGIKTDSEEGSPTYGLFQIAPGSSNPEMQEMDLKRFEDALSKNLEDVISLFAADDQGSTTSADFRYAQHIKGMTKAGSYSVSYTVADDGTVSEVLINGVKANQSDLEPNMYTVANAGAASGMSIKIDNLTPGTHTGSVSVKQGKVRQMEDFFEAELVYHEPNINEPSISENNGALMILQANYKQIMDSAEKKIQQEQDRLSRWERTQRATFARLETLLGQYQQNQSSLESQLKQFSN